MASERHPYAALVQGAMRPVVAPHPGDDGGDEGEPAELFERLAPARWIGDPSRSFEHAGAVHERPPTRAFVRAFCADAARVSTAEALARECAERLRGYGAAPVLGVRWSLWSVDLWRRGAMPAASVGDPCWSAAEALRGVNAASVEAATRAVDEATHNAHLVSLASWCARWEASRGAERNPFYSLLALHGAGCWLRGFTPEGIARLALPSLGA